MVPIDRALLRAEPLPVHDGAGDKEARGRVLVVGGCVEVPGAALLAAVGALRAGAGKLQVATCRSVAPHLGIALPEAMVLGLAETACGGIGLDDVARVVAAASRAGAVVVGPGMADAEETGALVAALLDAVAGVPMVLDAGALHPGALGRDDERLRGAAGRLVLTPHTGEMAHLLGVTRANVEADKLLHASDLARRLRCVVVMKGAATEVVSPSGAAWRYSGGTVGLATSGSGDTLAGIIGGLLARGAPPARAAIWGVYLHGEAGVRLERRLGGIGFLARELLDEVPGAMAEACAAATCGGA